MFVHLPQAESDIDRLIAEGRHNDALANIVVAVHYSHKAPEWQHKYLYYPELDRQMERLAQALPFPTDNAAPVGRNSLIVATELYQVGGHSRVVVDVMREAESPTLVLTDLFSSYQRNPVHLNWILDEFAHATVIVLPQRSLWAKCVALAHLTRRLAPRSILYFQHHQDPIAFVGTLGHAGSRKTLVHHCDHNPSLGCTVPALVHVDFTDELARTCTRELAREASVVPLYVPDGGCKRFPALVDKDFSVVTSGTHIKFARSGDVALQAIVRTVLEHVRGRFFHIGPIDAAWVDEIRAHLAACDIDPSRFVAMGPVPSLWAALASLPAHLYLGSAPVGGGRAAIEAQGCGYPVAFYRPEDADSTVAIQSIYASAALSWSNVGELAAVLAQFASKSEAFGADARGFYERRYSRAEFLRALASMAA